MNLSPATQARPGLQALQPSPRLPVLFLGHGSPMNAIEDNAFRRSWQALGQEFGVRWPRPQLILCVSAHWLTRGWWLTAMEQPPTIHDFAGFPQALFDVQYPAPGAPLLARELAAGLQPAAPAAALGLDSQNWGLDHGTWSVLQPMFPRADIPVLQLSMDYSRPPVEHFQLGQQLKRLRQQGVLLVGSGNIVHNLRRLQFGAGAHQAPDWAQAFDQTTADQLQQGQLAGLADFQQLGTLAQMAHPSHEHFLPLLYMAGAAEADEPLRFFNTGFQAGTISMRSVVWG